MKAFKLVKYGNAHGAFRLEEHKEPVPQSHEVKIKVEVFGLNFADVMARKGLYGDAPALPAVLGYEVVGVVVEQGNGVSKNWINKRVVAFTRFGAYAQFAVTSQSSIVEVDNHEDAGELLALTTQYCTAWYAAMVATTIQPNDVVLQHAAAGGVGIALTQLAKLRGAKVIGLVSNNNKADFLLGNGCDFVVNYTQKNYVEEVKKRFGTIDISFNSVAGASFKKDLALLNFGGRLVCYGAAERLQARWGFLSTLAFVLKMGRIMPIKLLLRSNSLIGVNMLRIADHKPDVLQTCLNEVYQLYKEGKIKPVIHRRYEVTDLPMAHADFESRSTIGKLVVKW